jgi:hypothetical protein
MLPLFVRFVGVPGAKNIALDSNYFFAFGHRDTGGPLSRYPHTLLKKEIAETIINNRFEDSSL